MVIWSSIDSWKAYSRAYSVGYLLFLNMLCSTESNRKASVTSENKYKLASEERGKWRKNSEDTSERYVAIVKSVKMHFKKQSELLLLFLKLLRFIAVMHYSALICNKIDPQKLF